MKRISSGGTVFHKRLFPLFWFGMLAFVVFLGLRRAPAGGGAWLLVAGAVFMAVLGALIMKKLVWDLADEVHDLGDYLLIRKGNEEERVPLSNIMNVSASTHINPPRVTLRLVRPGKFGPEITFTPRTCWRFMPFGKNPIVEDLIVRVDRARRA
jgi:hypothetical protein